MYNYYLSKINQIIRKKREKLKKSDIFYPRIEQVVDGYYLELWFSTKGCSFDKKGTCTMCNYGIGYQIDSDLIIFELENYLNKLDVNITELMISPSGSLWDTKEVDNELLNKIYNLVNKTNVKTFMIETRLDTITKDKVRSFREKIPNKKLIVEVGLESSDNWVLKYLINKNYDVNNFIKTVSEVKDNGIEVYTNISIGNAFLSPNEIIKDCLDSIEFAFKNGSTKVVLFPIHIKPNTFIEWLYKNKLYEPVSLWLLVDILSLIDKKLLKNVEIAWYKSYYEDDSKMVFSPTTCHKCRDTVIKLLDEYRATCEYGVVEKLNQIKCDCKTEYKNKLKNKTAPLLQRTIDIYKIASSEILKEEIDNNFLNQMKDEYVANF